MSDAEALLRQLALSALAERRISGDVHIHPISSGGGNYTSSLFLVTAGPLKAFAKIALIAPKLRELMNADLLYSTEQAVYSDLAPIYREIQTRNNRLKSFLFPEIYGTVADVGRETLLMEDLTAQGYKAPARHQPINWKFAAAAVSKLATFHALSFAFEKENPKEFHRMTERFKFVVKERDEEALSETWAKIVSGATQCVKDEYKPRLVQLLSNSKENFEKFKRPLDRAVLTHGDYRASNLLYKELEDGELDIVVVDYQTVNSGCPATDLLYFIFMGTDKEFRRQHYEDLLQHYHAELSMALDVVGVDVEEVYSKEVFEKEIKEMLPCTLHMSVVVLPLVMVDEVAAPNVAGEDADSSQFAIAPSERFAERFAGLVDDCVQWGAL